MFTHGKRNLFMDLLVIDTINKKAYVFGFDGELTMKVPDSMVKIATEKAKNGSLRKES
mgnify:CR=1 FL=1|jgi:hypothetical protein